MSQPQPVPPAVQPQPVLHTTCRICGAALVPAVSLGDQFLSDFPASAGTCPYPAVPMDVARCTHKGCGLVQLAYTTPRDWLYRQYWYRSGVNETMRQELADVVLRGLELLGAPGKRLTVADIGANDGTLLALYPGFVAPSQPLTRIAWEPATNLYAHCRPHADLLFPEFFHVDQDDQSWHGAVNLLTSIAMFYDLDDPHQFVGDAATTLARTGVWIVQQAYLLDMLDATGYDNIGHEHLEYYHLQPLEALLAAHGLEVFHVERRGINGGSFRTYIGWKGAHKVQRSVEDLRALEEIRYRDPAGVWAEFTDLARQRQYALMLLIDTLKDQGKVVDIYGASTKGSTLLQACHLDARVIRQAWERSPEKIGRYVGTSGIPIVTEAEGRANPPDALLVLPWGFRENFVTREQAYLASGGRLIFPLPTVEVVTGVGV